MWLRWLLQNHLISNPVTKKGINHVQFYYPRNTDDCTSSRFFTSPSRCCFRSHETKELQSGKHMHLGRQLPHFSGSSHLLLRPTCNHSSMDCGFEYRLLWCLLERPTERKPTYIAPHYKGHTSGFDHALAYLALTLKIPSRIIDEMGFCLLRKVASSYHRLSSLFISSTNLVLGETPWLLVLLTCLQHRLGSWAGSSGFQ